MDEIVKDFLIESNENLDRLDQELVKLESEPSSKELLASIFRTIHTIKGSCGFLGFARLEKVAHAGENLLSRLRDGQLSLDAEITSGLLAMVDSVRRMLGEIEDTEHDGENDYPELLEDLKRLQGGNHRKTGGSSTHAPAEASPTAHRRTITNEGSAPGQPEPTAEPVSAALRAATGNVQPAAELPVATVGPNKQEDTPAAPSTADSRGRGAGVETIRVGVNLLDKLMNLVGELVLARNQLLQFSSGVQDAGFQIISQRLNLIATELQEEVMKTRMQPIRNIWNKFPRTVRDLSLSCGKEVRLEMEGQDTELDRTIIEAIKDPLTHLVRNSMDHGIEGPDARRASGKDGCGCLKLRAFHEGGQVNIEIIDDGAGLNSDRIRKKAIERGLVSSEQATRMPDRDVFNMIFLPGFSTAEKVTNVSGRGVGMDVVKTNVEKIGGLVDVQSTPGKGTTVRVKIPLTLAIIPALVVTCGGDRFAIPQVNLLELVRLEGEQVGKGIEKVHGVPVHRLRGRLLPLVYLSRELQLSEKTDQPDEVVNIVVLQAGEQQFGLIVDEINDTEEIVVKPLRKQLKTVKTFAGSSIMGDGRVALILDVMGLAQRSGVIAEVRDHGVAEKTTALAPAAEKCRYLLFAGPGESRMAVPLDTLARLEELPSSHVEKAGMHWVAQYRGQILPLLNLEFALQERRRNRQNARFQTSTSTAPLQVLVCHHQGRAVGLVVEQILDIVEDAAELKYPASRPGVLYSTVIHERVTELIDIPALLRSAGLDSAGTRPAAVRAVEAGS